MPIDKEANAHSQPFSLPPLLQRPQGRDGTGQEGEAGGCTGLQAAAAVPGLPPPSHVSCSSSCPQVSHSLGQHTIQGTWVTPSVQERVQDHHEGPQEGSGWPRSTNSEAAAEAECPAPAPQGPADYEAALWDTAQRIVSEAVRRAVAEILGSVQEPEAQQDLAQGADNSIRSVWVNPAVQEHLQDAPAGPQEGSGLPSCTDTEVAAEAESPAPAQHSPTEDDVSLSDIVEYIVSEAVRRAEAEIQHLPSTAPLVPAADDEVQNMVSPVSGEHGGETSTDIVCLAHSPAPRRRPSWFRRALRALRRAFRCSCTAGQQEE